MNPPRDAGWTGARAGARRATPRGSAGARRGADAASVLTLAGGAAGEDTGCVPSPWPGGDAHAPSARTLQPHRAGPARPPRGGRLPLLRVQLQPRRRVHHRPRDHLPRRPLRGQRDRGTGAYGTLYRARDPELHRTVALIAGDSLPENVKYVQSLQGVQMGTPMDPSCARPAQRATIRAAFEARGRRRTGRVRRWPRHNQVAVEHWSLTPRLPGRRHRRHPTPRTTCPPRSGPCRPAASVATAASSVARAVRPMPGGRLRGAAPPLLEILRQVV